MQISPQVEQCIKRLPLSLSLRVQKRSLQNSAAENLFSKIDLTDTYLQISVDEEYPNLQYINTHKGLYKFERLPFGTKVVPAIVLQVTDTMLSGLKFLIAYLNDILMNSQSTEKN